MTTSALYIWPGSSSKGCSRNYPQGGHFFFRPLHPQDTHGVRAPRPPGNVSALINPPHYGSNMPWPPGQVTPHPPPHPSDTLSTKHPPPTGQKSVCGPPPEDNFWNSPKYRPILPRNILVSGRQKSHRRLHMQLVGTLGLHYSTSLLCSI